MPEGKTSFFHCLEELIALLPVATCTWGPRLLLPTGATPPLPVLQPPSSVTPDAPSRGNSILSLFTRGSPLAFQHILAPSFCITHAHACSNLHAHTCMYTHPHPHTHTHTLTLTEWLQQLTFFLIVWRLEGPRSRHQHI